MKSPELTERPQERAYLVGVELRGNRGLLTVEESLSELSLLAKTAGLVVVGEAIQRMDAPNVNTFIGPGKAEEVHLLVEDTQSDVVLFDDELSPRHLRE